MKPNLALCVNCRSHKFECKGLTGKSCESCLKHRIICLRPVPLKVIPQQRGNSFKMKTKIDSILHRTKANQRGLENPISRRLTPLKLQQINDAWNEVCPAQGTPIPHYTRNGGLIPIRHITRFSEMDKVNYYSSRDNPPAQMDTGLAIKEMGSEHVSEQSQYALERFRLPSNDLLDGIHLFISKSTRLLQYQFRPSSLLAFGLLIQELIFEACPEVFGRLTIDQVEKLAPNLVDIFDTEILHRPFPDWILNSFKRN